MVAGELKKESVTFGQQGFAIERGNLFSRERSVRSPFQQGDVQSHFECVAGRFGLKVNLQSAKWSSTGPNWHKIQHGEFPRLAWRKIPEHGRPHVRAAWKLAKLVFEFVVLNVTDKPGAGTVGIFCVSLTEFQIRGGAGR